MTDGDVDGGPWVEIRERKLAHLDLCATGDVEARGSTLLEEVHLLHDALPELSAAEIDPSIELFGPSG